LSAVTYRYSIISHWPKIRKRSLKTLQLKGDTVNSNFQLFIKGIVHHNYASPDAYTYPHIRYFLHKSNDLSYLNYLQTGIETFDLESGHEMEEQIFFDRQLFPSGTEMFIIRIRMQHFRNDYAGHTIEPAHIFSLGKASSITSIVLP